MQSKTEREEMRWDAEKEKTAELLQQSGGPLRFGKHSFNYVQSNRETSETQYFSLNLISWRILF